LRLFWLFGSMYISRYEISLKARRSHRGQGLGRKTATVNKFLSELRGSHGILVSPGEPPIAAAEPISQTALRPDPAAPDFPTAIGVLPARHPQQPDPPQHLAKQPPVQMSASKNQ
jgi:hypothetical protein